MIHYQTQMQQQPACSSSLNIIYQSYSHVPKPCGNAENITFKTHLLLLVKILFHYTLILIHYYYIALYNKETRL
jgi:hypothetical protein